MRNICAFGVATYVLIIMSALQLFTGICAGETINNSADNVQYSDSGEALPDMSKRIGDAGARLWMVPARNFGTEGRIMYVKPTLIFVPRKIDEIIAVSQAPKGFKLRDGGYQKYIHRIWFRDGKVDVQFRVRYISPKIKQDARDIFIAAEKNQGNINRQARDFLRRHSGTTADDFEFRLVPFFDLIIWDNTLANDGLWYTLAATYRISQSEDHIELESAIGEGSEIRLVFPNIESFALFCEAAARDDVQFRMAYQFSGNMSSAALMRITASVNIAAILNDKLKSQGMTPDDAKGGVSQEIAREVANEVYVRTRTEIEGESDSLKLIEALRPTTDLTTMLFRHEVKPMEQLSLSPAAEESFRKYLEPWVSSIRKVMDDHKDVINGEERTETNESSKTVGTVTKLSGGSLSVKAGPIKIGGSNDSGVIKNSTTATARRIADKKWRIENEGDSVEFTEGETGFQIRSVICSFLRDGKEQIRFDDVCVARSWTRGIHFNEESGFSFKNNDDAVESRNITHPRGSYMAMFEEIHDAQKKLDKKIDEINKSIAELVLEIADIK